VTGYSFPIAVRLALAIAASDLTDLARSPAAELTAALRRRLPFLYTLTRTMFERFLPAKRYAVLEHFYRLPEPLIARFYAAELSRFDQLRMFVGMPPRGMSLRRLAPLAREVAP